MNTHTDRVTYEGRHADARESAAMARGAARVIGAAIALLAALAAAPAAGAQEVEPPSPQTITQLQNGLYSARVGDQVTVFLVTRDGILLGDPLTRTAAAWIAGELARRFKDQPIRYIVHSHHHFDRAEGAAWYPGSPERVAHKHFDREVTRARNRLPEWLRSLERLRDGRLQREEVAGTPYATLLATHDQNEDGYVDGIELYANVRDAQRTYGSRHTITLGGQTVELIHPGAVHAADMTVLYFPAERIVFAVDPPPVFTAPLTLTGLTAGDVHRWVTTVADLEFDTLLTGDGSTFSRAELLAARDYLHTLRNTVADGITEGRSLTELQATALDNLSSSPHAPERASHIAAMYGTLRMFTLEAAGIGLADYGFGQDLYCSPYDVCSNGGAVRALRGALLVRPTRRVLIVTEFTSSKESWSARARADYEEEFAFRAARGSVLFGYQFRNRWLDVVPLVGASLTSGDTSGAYRIREALRPEGGRHPIDVRQRMAGLTMGADLSVPVAAGFSLVVPVRLTRQFEGPNDRWPHRVDVQIGAGFSIRVLRHVY